MSMVVARTPTSWSTRNGPGRLFRRRGACYFLATCSSVVRRWSVQWGSSPRRPTLAPALASSTIFLLAHAPPRLILTPPAGQTGAARVLLACRKGGGCGWMMGDASAPASSLACGAAAASSRIACTCSTRVGLPFGESAAGSLCLPLAWQVVQGRLRARHGRRTSSRRALGHQARRHPLSFRRREPVREHSTRCAQPLVSTLTPHWDPNLTPIASSFGRWLCQVTLAGVCDRCFSTGDFDRWL